MAGKKFAYRKKENDLAVSFPYGCVFSFKFVDKLANCIVEASVLTIILFCIIHKDVDNLCKWQTFQPKGLHQSQISHPHAKSGSDEGLWAETSAIYINYQHLCRLHKRE